MTERTSLAVEMQNRFHPLIWKKRTYTAFSLCSFYFKPTKKNICRFGDSKELALVIALCFVSEVRQVWRPEFKQEEALRVVVPAFAFDPALSSPARPHLMELIHALEVLVLVRVLNPPPL